jgi:ATP-dependent Clp protease ATP-binding subunit ClpA
MIAQELEVSLHMAFVEARQKRHEFITVEHLLLALLDNPTAAEVLRACGANMDELRKSLTQHIAEQTPRIAADREVDTQPTLGFQRVIQRAILHVQSSGKKEVTAPTCWSPSSARRIPTRSISSSSRASRAWTW